MPTYEYECTKCGHTFERFQQMTADPLRKCPECGGKLRRLIGIGAGVIMKGSGAHTTDLTRCGGTTPCCGRETPCDVPPCNR
jgi:putative FmdB family regulatory protein